MGVITEPARARRSAPTPYASWSARTAALHGILAALYEREASGVGQRVDTTLVQGFAAHDTWNWMIRHIVAQYPEAFTSGAASPTTAPSVPNNPLFFRLLVGLSADGRWMQFSQTTDAAVRRRSCACIGLDWMFDDPKWKTVPDFDDVEQRHEYCEHAARAVRAKTSAEWHGGVRRRARRVGRDLPPRHRAARPPAAACTTGRWSPSTTPTLGAVRQPGPMVAHARRDARAWSTARRPRSTSTRRRRVRAAARRPHRRRPAVEPTPPSAPPLDGVTVLELGTYYAAPYGATLLTDLGARVIKIEQLDGDPIRHIIPFPEVGAVKVLQGKESVAVDIHTDDGREIVHELVRRADAVLRVVPRRRGRAPRARPRRRCSRSTPTSCTSARPGYGVDGPCGHRPAFAPTIGAGSGLAYAQHRRVGTVSGPDLDVEVVKPAALRISAAAMGVGHADGFSRARRGDRAAARAARPATRRAGPGDADVDAAHRWRTCSSEDMVEYDGAPDPPHGRRRAARPLRALPPLRDRRRLGVPRRAGARRVGRRSSPRSRRTSTSPPTRASPTTTSARRTTTTSPRSLAGVSAGAAGEWENDLLAHDVGCLRVRRGAPDRQLFAEGGIGEDKGWITEVEHPVIGTHPRLMPLVDFSRSATVVQAERAVRRAHRRRAHRARLRRRSHRRAAHRRRDPLTGASDVVHRTRLVRRVRRRRPRPLLRRPGAQPPPAGDVPRAARRPRRSSASTGMGHVLTTKEAAMEAFRRPEVFSSAATVDTLAMGSVRPLIPLQIDPPDHLKYRKILDPLFAPRQMAALEEPVAALVNDLIDGFVERGECDFAERVLGAVPVAGVPHAARPAARPSSTLFLQMKDGIIRPDHVVGKPRDHAETLAYQNATGAVDLRLLRPACSTSARSSGATTSSAASSTPRSTASASPARTSSTSASCSSSPASTP